MSGFCDATCPKCGKRVGWFGEVEDRPPCSGCGHEVSREELDRDGRILRDSLVAASVFEDVCDYSGDDNLPEAVNLLRRCSDDVQRLVWIDCDERLRARLMDRGYHPPAKRETTD